MQRLRMGNFQSLFASQIIYKSAWFFRGPHGLVVVWVAAACVNGNGVASNSCFEEVFPKLALAPASNSGKTTWDYIRGYMRVMLG